jgi:hypothetical protein
MVPHTAYERRRELRVRESRHSFMLFDKKYYDCESGKFIRDKLPIINSYSLCDFYEDEYTDNYNKRSFVRENKHIPNMPKFIPKDNDWDDEIEEDQEIEKPPQNLPQKPPQDSPRIEFHANDEWSKVWLENAIKGRL